MYRNKITKYGLFITKDIFYNQLIFRVKKQLEGLENLRFNIDNHKDLLYDIFLNRYRDRISRFDSWGAHFDKMTEIFVDNYPSLSRQIWVAQDKEWADILTRKGYRIKSVAKSDNKSESDNTASVSSTPGDYSTNIMDEMIQSFNKNKSIVDTKGNTISDTEQYDLFNQLSKMVNIHIPRIFNNWIINFDKLFSNFDYQGEWAPCDIKNRYVFNFIYEFIQENMELFKGRPGKDGIGCVELKKDIDKKLENKVDKKDLIINNKGKWNKDISILDMNGQNIEQIGVLSFTNSVSLWTSDNKILNFKDNTLRGVKKIEGLNIPVDKLDAANKQYVDDEILSNSLGSIFKKTPGGGEYSKIDRLPLGLNRSRISELAEPISDDDATTKEYVDTKINSVKGGGGPFVVDGNNFVLNSPENQIIIGGKFYSRISEPFKFMSVLKGARGYSWSKNYDEYNIYFNGGVLEGVGDPYNSKCATNKKYVDEKIKLMFQELGFPKDKIQLADDKLEKEYQLSLTKDKK